MTSQDLIMELTLEQGPGRITQVQPPVGAWALYFGIDLDDPPRLRLRNRGRRNAPIQIRPVVEHDHNWTIEIHGAQVVRPAIIRFHRTGQYSYEYWIYGSNQPEYSSCSWLLGTFQNPHHHRGRRWIVI
jgi:hypothetical protein